MDVRGHVCPYTIIILINKTFLNTNYFFLKSGNFGFSPRFKGRLSEGKEIPDFHVSLRKNRSVLAAP